MLTFCGKEIPSILSGDSVCRLVARTTGQDEIMGMQGASTMQQMPQELEPLHLPPAAMYGQAPSLQSESTMSQISSVASLQQMIASGQVDQHLLSTLQGLSVRQPGLPGRTSRRYVLQTLKMVGSCSF